MQQAIFEFSGSVQEGRVTVANAQLEVEGGDVERALSMLRGVAPGSFVDHSPDVLEPDLCADNTVGELMACSFRRVAAA